METSGATPATAVHAADLAGLVQDAGPFVTLYQSTEAAVENAAQQSEVRWKSFRDRLAADGAPEAVLERIDPLIADAHHAGAAMAVVASPGGVMHVEHHPVPVVDRVQWAPLPSLVPLLEWRQDSPAHLVVTADRQGADIVGVRREGPDVRREAGGEDEVIRKVNAGGWSQRRYQERAENTWEKNADDVAAQVTRLFERLNARLVVVAGDVRAVTLLREALPQQLVSVLEEVQGGRSADGSGDQIAEQVREVVDRAVRADTDALLEKFREELGQQDRAADGPDDTLLALASAQVDVLLVHDDIDDMRTAWFGTDPTAVSRRPDALADMGVDQPTEGRLVDVAVRAALGTGAAIRVVDAGSGPTGGIGAVLRWSNT